MSLSLHAGATVGELHRAAADPDRVVIVEANAQLPAHARASRRSSPHALHVDEVDVIVRDRRAPFVLADAAADRRRPRDRRARARVRHRRLHAADRHRRRPVDGRRRCSPRRTAATTACTRRCSRPGSCSCTEAGKVTNARKGEFHGLVGHDVRARHRRAVRVARRQHRRALPAGRGRERAAHDRPQPPASSRSTARSRSTCYGQVVGRPPRRPPVLGHRRPRGLRRAVRARARGPLADLPAVDGDASTARSCRGSSPTLPPGTTVTTPRHQVDVVITEYGVAELRGATMRERARRARRDRAPDFRDELRAAASRRSAYCDVEHGDRRALARPPRRDRVDDDGPAHEPTDVPLTDAGRAAARALAPHLRADARSRSCWRARVHARARRRRSRASPTPTVDPISPSGTTASSRA